MGMSPANALVHDTCSNCGQSIYLFNGNWYHDNSAAAKCTRRNMYAVPKSLYDVKAEGAKVVCEHCGGTITLTTVGWIHIENENRLCKVGPEASMTASPKREEDAVTGEGAAAPPIGVVVYTDFSAYLVYDKRVFTARVFESDDELMRFMGGVVAEDLESVTIRKVTIHTDEVLEYVPPREAQIKVVRTQW